MLGVWTIYDHPQDYQNGYIARLHAVRDGATWPTEHAITAPDLDAVRALLPPGLFCLGREPADDPCIVESWI